jgi:hypothetical protein
MKDVRAGDRFDTFDAGTQPVLVQELPQHERDRFVERTAAGDAEDRHFSLPLMCQIVLFDERQFGNRIGRGFERRFGFSVVRAFADRSPIIMIDKIVDNLGDGCLDRFGLDDRPVRRG